MIPRERVKALEQYKQGRLVTGLIEVPHEIGQVYVPCGWNSMDGDMVTSRACAVGLPLQARARSAASGLDDDPGMCDAH